LIPPSAFATFPQLLMIPLFRIALLYTYANAEGCEPLNLYHYYDERY